MNARARRRGADPARTRLCAVLAALLAFACDSTPDIPPQFVQAPAPEPVLGADHTGPVVVAGEGGTARFVQILYRHFEPQSALELVERIDGYYRAPANDGYEESLALVKQRLAAAGFGAKPGLELDEIRTELTAPSWGVKDRVLVEAWTPLSAKVALVGSDGAERALHEFTERADPDRTCLPMYASTASVKGPLALRLDELEPGAVLVTDAAPTQSVVQRAVDAGAVAVVSCFLESYNVDPSGTGRERDAIQFRSLPVGAPIPVWMISPRSAETIRAVRARDPGVQIHLESKVKADQRPLRTLVARVVGRDRPDETIVIASHVQEPGACDNASGVAGLCESACSLAELLVEGRLERPSRSIVFLWGDEMRQTTSFLDSTRLKVIAGLSSDMTGESYEKTGAIALLERMPDPGALAPLPPDQHTPWGHTEVDPQSLKPNGLALVARMALQDVAQQESGWTTAEHPYEGGSDHDKFIERGIPAALFWHFTDFTYHTSLDRLEMVDASEMRRMGVALLATALALADPKPSDLDRYLRSLNEEENLRCKAAQDAGDEECVARWREWCAGSRNWLRVECLQIPEGQR